jgi:hypothetical protein
VLVAAIAWLYPAAYFLMLEGKVYRQIGVASATGQNLFEIEPRYRFSENWAAVGLRPANWIDRCVRRDYWETVESFGKKWKNPKSVGQRA